MTTPTVCPVCSQPDEPGGCDCYGIPPHAPSSADLAAFRSALHGIGYPADERRNGIGGRGVRHGHWYTAGDDHAEARREAAAMRTRAYEREYGSWQYACNVARDRGYDAGDWRPFIATEPDRAAHQAFVPR